MNKKDNMETLKQIKTLIRGVKNNIMNDFRNYSEPREIFHLDNASSEINHAIYCLEDKE